MDKFYLGIDIGGTKIKTVVLNHDGEILERDTFLTQDDSEETQLWKEKIKSIIAEMTNKYAEGNNEKLLCGISAPGLVDLENRMTLQMPKRLQGIEKYNWSFELKREIKVINDGHSACLAEYESFYKAKGIRHFLMVTLGTGVGGGIIIDGNLFQGNLQRAGHIGHMTLDVNGASTMTNMPGSLEYAMGNFSVSERTNGEFNSVRKLVEAYEKGHAKAEEWWLDSVRKLAVGLASLTNIISPELIVLGGGITAGAGKSLMIPLAKYMSDFEWRPGGHKVKIIKAKHGAYAGAMGAAFFMKNNFTT